MNKEALYGAIEHAVKVGAYIVGSGFLALAVSALADNPAYIALAPLINIVAALLVKYSQLSKNG
jgi:hypothetical protein